MSRRFVTLDVFTADRADGKSARGRAGCRGPRYGGHAGDRSANSICPRRCSSSDRTTRDSAPIFASSRPRENCRSPVIRPSARRFFLPSRPGWQAGRDGFRPKERSASFPARSRFSMRATAARGSSCRNSPRPGATGRETTECAWALGLDPTEIGFERHVPSRHSAGVPYDLVPVSSLDALARAKAKRAKRFDRRHSATAIILPPMSIPASRMQTEFVFARACSVWAWASPKTRRQARPRPPSAGALMQCEPLGDGEHDIVIEQGVEMGRPSVIDLQMTIKGGALVSAEIGGNAVVMSRGELL